MEDLSKIRVVCVKDRHEYFALSYCWGKAQPLATTLKKENFVHLQTGIQLASLAKTIQDAIVFCRKLNARYLWVDALCIIQDDGVDWSSESQKMALIYAQAYVTISAASAKASDESFLFQPREHFISAPFRERSQSLPNGELLFSEPSFDFAEHFETATYGSALAHRAWVMQERLFSRRIIHSTKRQIYWECRSFFWAENGEQTTTLAADSIKTAATFMKTLWSLMHSEGNTHAFYTKYMFLRTWSEIVNDYSELELTYETDRLPAIEGLARAASLVFPGRCLCGIWEQTLSSGLLWAPKMRPLVLSKERIAPSWSWASTTGAIRSGGVSNLQGTSDYRITLEEVLPTSEKSDILVLSGQIQPCYVSVVAEQKPVRRRLKDTDPEEAITDNYSFWPSVFGDSDTAQEGANNTCRFDAERGTKTDFFFLRLECSENLASNHCRGLLLRSENDDVSGQPAYTRIGIGWASDLAWHESSSSMVQLK